MTYALDLAGSRAKLLHAKELISELDASVRVFFEQPSHCPPILCFAEPSSDLHVLRVGAIPEGISEFQTKVALSIGDVVHNLRSALDHLAWQVCLAGTGGVEPPDPHVIQFPIVHEPEKFEAQAARRLPTAAEKHVAVIDSFQPFHGAAGRPDSYSGPYIHQLAQLQVLSNQDKHRLLTTVLGLSSGFELGFSWTLLEPREVDFHGFKITTELEHLGHENAYLLSEGAPVGRGRFRKAAPPEGSVVGRSRPSLGLEENRPIAPTLTRLADYVELITDGIERQVV